MHIHIELIYEMKKINPKVATVVALLLTMLVGGLAIDRAVGEPTHANSAGGADDTGIF